MKVGFVVFVAFQTNRMYFFSGSEHAAVTTQFFTIRFQRECAACLQRPCATIRSKQSGTACAFFQIGDAKSASTYVS
jgi:hypothetical protein